MKSKLRVRPLPIAIFVGLVGLFLSQNLLSKTDSNTQKSIEAVVANWNDGTDAFYQQVIKSKGAWVENAGIPIFDNQPVASLPPKPEEKKLAKVLGSHIASDGSEKWIEIDLSEQKLYAREGERKVLEFFVSTGRDGYNTPEGEYRVWRKVRSQAYKGGSEERGDYYYLPNVPHSLFFGGGKIANSKGYAIHGAYWHNDFGIRRRSHGCVNLSLPDAEQVYNWAGPCNPWWRWRRKLNRRQPGSTGCGS